MTSHFFEFCMVYPEYRPPYIYKNTYIRYTSRMNLPKKSLKIGLITLGCSALAILVVFALFYPYSLLPIDALTSRFTCRGQATEITDIKDTFYAIGDEGVTAQVRKIGSKDGQPSQGSWSACRATQEAEITLSYNGQTIPYVNSRIGDGVVNPSLETSVNFYYADSWKLWTQKEYDFEQAMRGCLGQFQIIEQDEFKLFLYDRYSNDQTGASCELDEDVPIFLLENDEDLFVFERGNARSDLRYEDFGENILIEKPNEFVFRFTGTYLNPDRQSPKEICFVNKGRANIFYISDEFC